MKLVSAACGAEDVGVGSCGVLVIGPERKPAPIEEVDFLGGVKRVGAKDLKDKRLGEGNGTRVEITSARLGQSFGEGCDCE